MTKRTVIYCIISLLLVAYVVVAMMYTSQMAAADRLKGFDINITDNSGRGFVSAEDLNVRLDSLAQRVTSIARSDINTLEIEHRITALDNIESAECYVRSNGVVQLDVTPLQPVARIFDLNGESYYVNRQGKRMAPNPRFRLDLPVVTGRFSNKLPPTYPVPVIDHITANADRNAFFSAIHVSGNGDIILIPAVSGHVVNFGDTTDIANKFRRLESFYHQVMPVRGWAMYDTIAVKWRGQVVAHRAEMSKHEPVIAVEEFDEPDDLETIQTE